MPDNTNEQPFPLTPNEDLDPLDDLETVELLQPVTPLPAIEIDWTGIDPSPVTEGPPPSIVEYPKEIHGVIPENMIQMVLLAPLNKTIRTMLQSHTSKPIPDELVTADALLKFILTEKPASPPRGTNMLEMEMRHTRIASGRCNWTNTESGHQTLRYSPSDIQELCDDHECESVAELQERIDDMAREDADTDNVDFITDGEEDTSNHEITDSSDYTVDPAYNHRRRTDNLIVWLRNNLPELLDNLDH